MSIPDFEALDIKIPEKGIFIIVICSKWCKSCRLLSPILNELKEQGIIKVKELDIADNSKLAHHLEINAVPALIFFKDGNLSNKKIELFGEILVNNGILIGTFNEDILKEIIEQI
ncbi:MAG: hypothetical protein GF383_12640 [Candidatus Lokiarchaeota archaeon]|nr:hypothetical protein [Candidatus Lokiarchaeota archaeon]MBD3341906.1 hypothetical protein [Candidatus Lokiarchaeota archaeon]